MSQEWQLPVPMRLVDVAAQTREMRGAEKETDWRFEARLPGGATVTFSRDTAAADIAQYLKREGVEIPPGGDPA